MFYINELSEEEYHKLKNAGKLYSYPASDKTYTQIKQMGDYVEDTIKGVSVLIDHSCEKLDKFVIYKIPPWIEDLNSNLFPITDKRDGGQHILDEPAK